MAEIISGVELSKRIKTDVKIRVSKYRAETCASPMLAIIKVGDDPASTSYVTGKVKACAECDINSLEYNFPAENVTEDVLISLINKLNKDEWVDGILVQLPLPKDIDARKVLEHIMPEKDVDGFTAKQIGNCRTGSDTALYPCTPSGIVSMLKFAGVSTCGKNVVIVGRSNTVGTPLASILSSPGYDATVTLCNSKTENLAAYTKNADILISAVGKAGLITGDMIKPGAVVIDVGVNRIPDASKTSGFRLVGDCDFESVSAVASKITPVPGGVGPMTIAQLMSNVVTAAQNRHANDPLLSYAFGGCDCDDDEIFVD